MIKAQMQENLYPLSLTEAGQSVMVKSTGSGKNVQYKLLNMGIKEGTLVKVIKNDFGYPMLLLVGDTKLIIGQGIAHKIMVCA